MSVFKLNVLSQLPCALGSMILYPLHSDSEISVTYLSVTEPEQETTVSLDPEPLFLATWL